MIAEKIKALREARGWSQAELSRRLGITRNGVNSWEQGLSMPSPACLVDLAKVFGVSTDYLLGLERLTRAGIILPVPDHTAASVVRALNGLERRLGKDFYPMFQSITVDNGCEFQDYDGMEKACRRKGKRTTVYYCHPHAPHERGSNENMNRIIRRFFPKGTNFDEVPISEIRRAEEWMNNYPREVLGWQTAATLLRSYMSAC